MAAQNLACGHLPGDMMLEILIRLPPKALMKFKCTKKSWYSLVKDPYFIKMHSDHWSQFVDNEDSSIIVGYDNEWKLQIFFSRLNKWEKLGIFVDSKPFPVGVSKGLICFTHDQKYGEDFLVINPATRESKLISRKLVGINKSVKEEEFVSAGFGYSQKHDDFKIVRIEHLKDALGFRSCKVDLYSLYTDSWKSIECSENLRLYCWVGIQVGDSLYFISNCGWEITVFSLSNDIFYSISCPGPIYSSFWRIENRDRETLIAAVYNPDEEKFWYWITSPKENPENPGVYSFCWKRDRLFPQEKVDRLRNYQIGSVDPGFCGFVGAIKISSYVENMVPVNQQN